MGRRLVSGRAEQQPQTTTSNNALFNPHVHIDWSGVYTQPLLRNFRIDSTRQQLAGHEDQPRHLGRAAARDDHQHAVERPQRVLGLRVRRRRRSKSRSSRSISRASWCRTTRRASRSARWRRSTSSRRSREQATRRQALVTAAVDAADRRAGAEAADRRRHRRIRTGTRQLDPIDRPDFRARADRHRRRPSAARSASGPTSRSRRRTSQTNDVTLKYLRDQTAAAGRPRRRPTASSGMGGTQLITQRHRRASAAGHRDDSRRLSATRFSTLFRNNYPRWNVRAELSATRSASSSQEASVARARVQLNQVQAQMKQIELQVATDVTNAAIQAQNNAEARAGRAGGARARAEEARGRAEQVRGRHVDELLRRAGAARSVATRRTASCARFSTTASRSSSSSACSRRRCRTSTSR